MTNEDQNSGAEKDLPPLDMSFDAEEMSAAASRENAAMQDARLQYLVNRVAILRAVITRLQHRNAELEAENAELRSREE